MYVYGRNVAKEIISNKKKINKVYLKEEFKDNEILLLLKNNNIKYTYLPNKVLDSKVDGVHQGIIIDIDEVDTYDLDYILDLNVSNPFVVMLDHIEDPHNFGAIIRTCEALGVDSIIIPNDRSCNINSTVIKTSVGAIYNYPIVRVNSLSAAINKLRDNGYWIIGTDMQGEDYNNINYDIPICLIIGNEGKGISKTLYNLCDYMAMIPMRGKINSLNASVSCGIMVAKIVNSRSENGL